MLNPYIITTFLYFLVGILAAIDASLVSFSIVPYLSQRALFPKQKARLGGNMISLIMVNLGGLFLWISIFASGATQIFNALAYASWAIAATSIGIELWQIVKKGVTQLEII